MTKLSDTQLVILSAACQRDDRLVLPLPDRLKGGAANKVISSLIAKGLVKEVRAKLDQPVWHETDDDKRITLVATDAAFEALGIAPDDAPAGADRTPDREPERQGAKTSKSAPAAPPAPATRKTREGSKQARLIEMLKRPEGVTISEAAKALEWQSHTVRGAIAGALKKKLGLTIDSEKVEDRGRVYRISS
jgi:hypothetical protein